MKKWLLFASVLLVAIIPLASQQVFNPGGGSASGSVTGSGTANTVAKWTSGSAIGNSACTENGTTFACSEPIQAGGAGNGTLKLPDGSANNMQFIAPTSWGVPVTGQAVVCGTGASLSCTLGFATIPAAVTTNQNIRTVGASFGDFSSGASAISGAQIACVPSYFAGTISAVELIATPSGSVTVDVKTVAHGSFTGPASTSSITASDIPALSSAPTYSDTTLTGWTTSVSAGTDFCFYLTSPTTVAGVAISVKMAAN